MYLFYHRSATELGMPEMIMIWDKKLQNVKHLKILKMMGKNCGDDQIKSVASIITMVSSSANAYLAKPSSSVIISRVKFS